MAVMIGVPALSEVPPGLKFMLTQWPISGRTLLKKLNECSRQNRNCIGCPVRDQCEAKYDEIINRITNWQGANRNVSRYYE